MIRQTYVKSIFQLYFSTDDLAKIVLLKTIKVYNTKNVTFLKSTSFLSFPKNILQYFNYHNLPCLILLIVPMNLLAFCSTVPFFDNFLSTVLL